MFDAAFGGTYSLRAGDARASFALVASLFVVVLAATSSAAATLKCTKLCPGTTGVCNVTPGPITIPAGSVVNCTGREVVVPGFTTIKVDDGSFKLTARSLSVASSSMIKAVDTSGLATIGIEIETTGTVAIYGSLQADANSGGGRIAVDAGGDILIANDGTNGVEASGTAPNADGGEIDLRSGGTLMVQNPVRARSAEFGDVVGGHIAMNAARDVVIATPNARVSVNGSKMDAGSISVTAGRDIRVLTSARLEADSRYIGGKGGGISLTAANRVELASDVSARGGIEAHSESSNGGTLEIESGCGGVRLYANIDLRGGEFGGGSLEVDTIGDLAVAPAVTIETRGSGSGGPGGDVSLVAGRKVSLGSKALIDARGDATDAKGNGHAGNVELSACEVDVADGAKIDTRGRQGGDVALNAASDGAAQPTTLHVAATSTFDSTASKGGRSGEVRVAIVNEALSGRCSTNPSRVCAVDAPDCTVGFTLGQCRGLNPDTDNTIAQFLVRPKILPDKNMTGCADACP